MIERLGNHRGKYHLPQDTVSRQVFRMGHFAAPACLARSRDCPAHPNRILELLEKEPIDLIHAHSPALCGLGALQAARSKRLLSL